MTEVFTADTTIDRPVDVVWARLIDWDSATRWMPGVDALNLRSVQGGVTADYVYTCSAYGDGTRVRLLADCKYDRSSSAAQPANQDCHPQGGQRPARRVRSHLHPGVNSGSAGRVPSTIGDGPPRTGAQTSSTLVTVAVDGCRPHSRRAL